MPCRDGNNGAIIDYRTLRKPVLAYSLRDIDILDAFSVDVKDSYLYVLSMTNCKISVFDISNPYKPEKITAISVGGEGSYLSTYQSNYTRLRKIRIQGNYAYVTHSSESKVYILNIQNPSRPFIVSSFHTGDGAFALLPYGNVLFLAGYGPGSSVIAVDVSSKTNPRINKRIYDTSLLKGTCAFALQGNKLYATGYDSNTFLVFDVTDPLNFKLEAYIKEAGINGPGRVVASGNTAYIINAVNDAVTAIDITNPANPLIKYYLQDSMIKRTYGIAIDKNLLFLAGREGRSFVILDLNKL